MPRKSLLAEVADALVSILPKMKDPQHCKPGDLVKFLNSTPAGEVLTPAKLRGHRDRAGLRIGDGKTVDLFRYVAWLASEFQPSAPPEEEPLYAEPASADPTEKILRTRAEAAEYFGVDERTVAKWLTQDGFPGKAGTRGQRNGRFPALEIAAWRDGRRVEDEIGDDESGGKNFEQAGLIRAKRQLAELDLAERTAQLVDAQEVTGRMVRLAAEAAAVLRQLPAEIVAQMPEEIDAATIAHMRELARLRVEQALRCLAEAARSVAGEEEHDDEADAEQIDPAPATPPERPKVKAKPKPRSRSSNRAAGKGGSRRRPAKRK